MLRYQLFVIILIVEILQLIQCNGQYRFGSRNKYVNNYKFHNNSRYFYPKNINTRRIMSNIHSDSPLWLLQGNNNKNINRYNKSKNYLNSGVFIPKLPNHYNNNNNQNHTNFSTKYSNQNRNNRSAKKNENFYRSLPRFQQTDTSVITTPYQFNRGARAKLIFNTLTNGKNYNMQEPVPGQVMYPPTTPFFRSNPTFASKNISMKSDTDEYVYTGELVPFYSHEAVLDNNNIQLEVTSTTVPSTTMKDIFAFDSKKTLNQQTSTAPSVIYGFPYTLVKYPDLLSTTKSTGNSNYKRYSAYRTGEDVQIVTPSTTTYKTTNYLKTQIVPPSRHKKNYKNHKMEIETTPITINFNKYKIQDLNEVEPNKPTDQETFETSTFRIIYVTPEPKPIIDKKYSSKLKAEYKGFHGGFVGSFPVYTLNKLFKDQRRLNFKNNIKYFVDNIVVEDAVTEASKPFESDTEITDCIDYDNTGSCLLEKKDKIPIPSKRSLKFDQNSLFNIHLNNGIERSKPFKNQKVSSKNNHKLGGIMYSKKAIPKIHEASAVLGTGILVD